VVRDKSYCIKTRKADESTKTEEHEIPRFERRPIDQRTFCGWQNAHFHAEIGHEEGYQDNESNDTDCPAESNHRDKFVQDNWVNDTTCERQLAEF
jgi:hypothetical protein